MGLRHWDCRRSPPLSRLAALPEGPAPTEFYQELRSRPRTPGPCWTLFQAPSWALPQSARTPELTPGLRSSEIYACFSSSGELIICLSVGAYYRGQFYTGSASQDWI